jgi:AraC family transcriptional regulator
MELVDPIRIVGLSVDTSTGRAAWDVFWLRRAYRRLDQAGAIVDKKVPARLLVASKDFDPDTRAFTYIMGAEVTTLENKPARSVGFEIPAATYAVFTVRPRHRFNWARAIASAKTHAYLRWLPPSEHEAWGSIDDFELHDERSRRTDAPEIDLYVAVKRRTLPTRPPSRRPG